MSRAILLLPLCACMACYCDTFVFQHTRKPYTSSVHDITRVKHSYSSATSVAHVTVHTHISVFCDMTPCCPVKNSEVPEEIAFFTVTVEDFYPEDSSSMLLQVAEIN